MWNALLTRRQHLNRKSNNDKPILDTSLINNNISNSNKQHETEELIIITMYSQEEEVGPTQPKISTTSYKIIYKESQQGVAWHSMIPTVIMTSKRMRTSRIVPQSIEMNSTLKMVQYTKANGKDK